MDEDEDEEEDEEDEEDEDEEMEEVRPVPPPFLILSHIIVSITRANNASPRVNSYFCFLG